MRSAIRSLSEALFVNCRGVRPTVAVIDLARLCRNWKALCQSVGVPVWGVVKADAYGHGALEIARALQQTGVAGLCVSLLEEAIDLRDGGIVCPILVMGGNYQGAYAELLERQLIPVVSQVEQIDNCAAQVRKRSAPPLPVHIKLDTGMARLGAAPEQWVPLASRLRETPEVVVRGLMTHLACAGEDEQSVARQLDRFESGCASMFEFCTGPWVRHAANTAGAVQHPASRLDFVRIGIGLYGYAPGASSAPKLYPVMRVHTQVVALRTLQPGQAIGYSSTYRAKRITQVATIPFGYADGLPRSMSPGGELLVRGQHVPIVGAVSMDMTTLDVSNVPGVQLGDEVVYLGEQSGPTGPVQSGAEQLAAQSGRIAWEVLTDISRRVPRVYLP